MLSSRSIPCCSSRFSLRAPLALLACAGLLAAASPAMAQFSDACAAAPTVAEGLYSFDLMAANSEIDYEPGCADGRQPFIDQWIRFMPSATGPVRITTVGLTAGDTVLTVHGNECEFFFFGLIACNDDAGGPQSQIQLSVTAGEPVLLRIAGALMSRPSGSVRIEALAPLTVGGSCENPDQAVLGTNWYDSTRSADGAVWFTYTPPVNGALRVLTCSDPAGSAVVQPFCGPAILAATPFGACELGMGVQAGVPLLIRVGAFNSTGPLQFEMTLDPNGLPANDECINAIAVNIGQTNFDNTFASDDGTNVCIAPGFFPFVGGLDLWYTFTPSASGTYDISTELSEQISDTQLAISQGCDQPSFACNDDARGFRSFIRTDLTASQTYTIRLAGAGDPAIGTPIDRGQGILSIRRSNAPLNDDCSAAISIGDGNTTYDIYDATTGTQQPACIASQFASTSDIWFRYVPTFTGNVRISSTAVDNPSGLAGVFTSCNQAIAAFDAGTVVDSMTGFYTPTAVVPVNSGAPILIRVAYSQLAADPLFPTGSGTLTIAPSMSGPVNDRCVDAQVITPGMYSVDLTNSIKDCSPAANSADPARGITDNDLFYSYTPGERGIATITLADGVSYPEFAGLVASVYSACGGAPIASSFTLGDAPSDSLSFAVNPSSNYIIRIASVIAFSSGNPVYMGSFTLSAPVAACSLADLVGGGGNPPADGALDGNDFQAFLNAFGASEPLADIVGGDGNPPADENVDGNDFQAFLNAFGAGC